MTMDERKTFDEEPCARCCDGSWPCDCPRAKQPMPSAEQLAIRALLPKLTDTDWRGLGVDGDPDGAVNLDRIMDFGLVEYVLYHPHWIWERTPKGEAVLAELDRLSTVLSPAERRRLWDAATANDPVRWSIAINVHLRLQRLGLVAAVPFGRGHIVQVSALGCALVHRTGLQKGTETDEE